MPSYDFRCPACEERFEITRQAGSTESVCCPSCGSEAKRVFTPVGVVFKGSGFHNTDYRPRPAAEGESAPKPESSSCPAAKDGGSCATCPAAS
jgi:putative FmdB family regulatory protein